MASIKLHREFSQLKRNRGSEPQDDQVIAKELPYLRVARYPNTNYYLLEIKNEHKRYMTRNLFKKSQETSSITELSSEHIFHNKESGKDEDLQNKLRTIRKNLIMERTSFNQSKVKILEDFYSIKDYIKKSFVVSKKTLNELADSYDYLYNSKYANMVIQNVPENIEEDLKNNFIINPKLTGALKASYDSYIKSVHNNISSALTRVAFFDANNDNKILIYKFSLMTDEIENQKTIIQKEFEDYHKTYIKSFDSIIEKFKFYHGIDKNTLATPLNNYEMHETFNKDYPYFNASLIFDLYSFLKSYTSFVYLSNFGLNYIFAKENKQSVYKKSLLKNIPSKDDPRYNAWEKNLKLEEIKVKKGIHENLMYINLFKNSSSKSEGEIYISYLMEMMDLSLEGKTLDDFVSFIENKKNKINFSSINSDIQSVKHKLAGKSKTDPEVILLDTIRALEPYFNLFEEINSVILKLKSNTEMILKMYQKGSTIAPSPDTKIELDEDYKNLYKIYKKHLLSPIDHEDLIEWVNTFISKLEENNIWTKQINNLISSLDKKKIKDEDIKVFINYLIQFFDFHNNFNSLQNSYYSLGYKSIPDLFVPINNDLLIKYIDKEISLREGNSIDILSFNRENTYKNLALSNNENNIKWILSICQKRAELNDFFGYIIKDVNTELRLECQKHNYPFIDISGNPFIDLPIIEQKKQYLKKLNNPPFELFTDLTKIHETVVHGKKYEREFIEDLPESHHFDYRITYAKNYSNEKTSRVFSPKEASLGAYFTIDKNDSNLLNFYDVSTGKYGKIEIMEGDNKDTKFQKKKGLEDLTFIPYFNFVCFVKQDRYYFETKLYRDKRDLDSIKITKFENSDTSIPSKNNDIKEISSYCYDYKERHRGDIYSVAYDYDYGNYIPIAFDKKDVYNLMDLGKSYSSDNVNLNCYTNEALLFCANITKMNISQEMKNGDSERQKSLHSDNFFITVSVSKPGDIFYKKDTKFPYDVRIIASNIFPYLPIIGLHAKQATIAMKIDNSTSFYRDPIWVLNFRDVKKYNDREENRHYKYRTVEVHDAEEYKFNSRKTQIGGSVSGGKKTGAFLVYSTPQEYTLDILSLEGKSFEEMANNLRIESGRSKVINSSIYKANVYPTDVDNIVSQYPKSETILKGLIKEGNYAAYCPYKNKQDILIACRKLASATSSTLFSKMSTYSLKKYSLPDNESQDKQFYDFFMAINASDYKHHDFLTTKYQRRNYNGSEKSIKINIDNTNFYFDSLTSEEVKNSERNINIEIGSISYNNNVPSVNILNGFVYKQNTVNTKKSINISLDDIKYYIIDIYEKRKSGISITINDLKNTNGIIINNNGSSVEEIWLSVPSSVISIPDITANTISRELKLDEDQTDILKAYMLLLEDKSAQELIPVDQINKSSYYENVVENNKKPSRDISSSYQLKNFFFSAIISGEFNSELIKDDNGNTYSLDELKEIYNNLGESSGTLSILRTNTGLDNIRSNGTSLLIEDTLLNETFDFDLPISIRDVIKQEKIIINKDDMHDQNDNLYQLDAVVLTIISEILIGLSNNFIINLNYQYKNKMDESYILGDYLKKNLSEYNFSNNLNVAKSFCGFFKMLGISVTEKDYSIKARSNKKSKTYVMYREVDINNLF